MEGMASNSGGREARLLPGPMVLTFSTGLVDAASYLGLGRLFTANMTGNLVRPIRPPHGASVVAPIPAVVRGSGVCALVAAAAYSRVVDQQAS